MNDANQWLEENYPQNGVCRIDESQEWEDSSNNQGKKRCDVTQLILSDKSLTGCLDLSDFTNLIELQCWSNKLTQLILPASSKLKKLGCSNNQLSNLDLSRLVGLEYLSCPDNQLTSLILSTNFRLSKLICFSNQITQLILPLNSQLIHLHCIKNQLSSLDLTSCSNLQEVNLSENQLTQLGIPYLNRITDFYVGNNYLTDFFWHQKLNPETLVGLDLSNNNLGSADIIAFSQLVNLERLEIGSSDEWLASGQLGNQFIGSLAALTSLTKLTRLNILNLELENDLAYLPTNLTSLVSSGQIHQQLTAYGHNIITWQAYHPQLMKQAGQSLVDFTNQSFVYKKVISIALNIELSEEKLNYQSTPNYSDWILKDYQPFSWVRSNQLIANQSLPLRLLSLTTNQVVNSIGLSKSTPYFALSYYWGTNWETNRLGMRKAKKYGQIYSTRLTKLGRKALNKVQATYQFLKKKDFDCPDYIWIDNFCINQSDKEEKGQEVRNQKQYYSQAMATLIAIDASVGQLDRSNEYQFIRNIIYQITSSPWFHRAWTFQEGLLSRQTIFMFDDYLVDGRRLALYWGGQLGSYNAQQTTFITPLGWSYSNDLNRSVNMDLGEALMANNHRSQTVWLDKIYSLLGLFTYGDQVKVAYKDAKDYAQSELTAKLLELIEQAYSYNPQELLTYLGQRDPTNWWLPLIESDGSWAITDYLNSDEEADQYYLSQIKKISLRGIALIGHYTQFVQGLQVVELERNDQDNNMWRYTLQFLLQTGRPLIIQITEQVFYHQDQQPQDLFLDFISQRIIVKDQQPELYYQLINEDNLETKLNNYQQEIFLEYLMENFLNSISD